VTQNDNFLSFSRLSFCILFVFE